MKFDLKLYIQDKLEEIKQNNNLDCIIQVAEEQSFAKMKELTPDTIYVVIKELSSDIQYNVETTPVQIAIVSEENGLKISKLLFDTFTIGNNWKVVKEGTLFVKQQWNSPVVLNNYVEVGRGFRSSLYVSGVIYVMEEVLDVEQLQYIITTQRYNPDTQQYEDVYNRYNIKPLSFSFSYVMTPNTQPVGGNKIASSVKNVAVFSITFMIPLLDNELVKDIIKVTNGTNSGNLDFEMCFKVDNMKFGRVEDSDSPLNFKLTTAQVTTSPDQVPALQIGMML